MPTFVGIRSLSRSPGVRVPAVAAVAAPTTLAAAAVVGGGTFAADDYFWKVTAVGASGGETTASNEDSATIALNGSADLTWDAVVGAANYNIYRGTVTDTQNVLVGTSESNEFTDTGAAGTADTPPTSNTAWAADATLTAVETGVEVVVDLDDEATRKALNSHNSVGQWVVTSANSSTESAGALPANA